MRFAILGAGALGSIFSAKLAAAGHRVTLLGRSEAHVSAIRRHGLTVLAAPNQQMNYGSIDARVQSDGCEAADVAIFLTKAQDSAAVAINAGPLIGENTALVSLQNGIGSMELIEEARPGCKMIQGATTVGAHVVEPGRIEISPSTADSKAISWIGPWQGTADFSLTADIAETLGLAGLPTEAYPDVAPLIWTKLAMNCAMNAVGAISRSTVRQVSESQAGRSLIEEVIREVISVANAQNIDLDTKAVIKAAWDVYAGTANHIPSMAADLRAGRPTEVSALNEAVVAKAQSLGISVPLNATLVRLIRLSESGATRD